MIKINEKILGYIVLILVAGITSVTGFYVAKKIEKVEEPPQIILPLEKPSQYPDYDAIKGENRSKNIKLLNITEDCPNGGCINDRPATIDFDGIVKTYYVKGEFSRAYLYIEALVDYTRPLTSWDGIYFTINYWGGHLVTDENLLPVPPSEISRHLYNLRSVSFYETLEHKLNKAYIHANTSLFSLFTDGNILPIRVTASSDRPGRTLREVSIYYECFEGSNCSIQERKQ